MPGLLDLPPELIEHIFDFHVLMTPWEDQFHSGDLRLICTYIEKATRMSFRYRFFYSEVIRCPFEEYIQRFCDVAQVADLAESLENFTMHCADDGLTEQRAEHQQQHNEAHPVTGHLDLVLCSKIDRLVPAALTHRRDALLAAFSATKNITTLIFTDFGWASLQNRKSPFVTVDDFPPRPLSFRASKFQRDFVSDISSTFNFTLALAARAGLVLRAIVLYPLTSMKTMMGLTNVISLVTCGQLYCKSRH
jgi:hypothetical protein